MSATTVQLLHAAAGIVGGNGPLARELGISEQTLSLFLDGGRELPDTLLLRAVDIILANRHADLWPGEALRTAAEIPENPRRGNGATHRSGGGQ